MHTVRFISLSAAMLGLTLTLGCQTGTSDRSGSLGQLSNGPGLPEECNQCWEDFQDCFASGQPIAECENQIIECIDSCNAPPPPAECTHCAAGYEACTEAADQSGANPQDCAGGFEACLSICEVPEPPPVDDCDWCHAGFLECVDNADPGDQQAIEQCEQLIEECTQVCQPGDPGPQPPEPPPTGDECDACFIQAEECLNNQDPSVPPTDDCHIALEECVNQQCQPDEPHDPNCPECIHCEDALDQCLNSGNNPDDCFLQADECFIECFTP